MKLAILDMYNGTPNQGMRCIKEIIEAHKTGFEYEVFDVRGKCELPDLSFDAFISTGGPGDPLEGDGVWDKAYYQFLDQLWAYNASARQPKKYALFICHSFQMASQHLGLGIISKRHSMSFGTFPVHMTEEGEKEGLLDPLTNPFFVADFRNYQLTKPKETAFEAIGAEILALEKIRPHISLERAIMAIRFSEEWIGVQFHPEADPDGMSAYFQEEERKAYIIKTYGEVKFKEMIQHLNAPEKIAMTHQTVIPKFLTQAAKAIEN